MNQRTCTTCDAAYQPRHARQLYCAPRCRPKSHKTVTLTCDACGSPAVKEARARRYVGTYCSLLCRDYTRWGATSCDLPAKHWARMFGATCEWSPPLVRNTGECTWCGTTNTRSTLAAYCSPRCKTAAKHQRRRAAEYGAPGEYRYSEVIRQYRKQGHVCAYCELPVQGLPDPEHVIPLSRGGRNDMTNIVAACAPCNSDKRDLLLTEWNADRTRRGKQPVRTTLIGSEFAHLIAA